MAPDHARRCVGAFIWWAWGYGTAYHTADGEGNPFIGMPGKVQPVRVHAYTRAITR